VVVVTLDGFAAKHLAESWQSAPAEQRASALASFRADDSINFALLSPLNLVFAGFTFVLYGLAVAFSEVFPRWLGWIVAVAGLGGAGSGVIQANIGEPTPLTSALRIAAPTVITLWPLVVGSCCFAGGETNESTARRHNVGRTTMLGGRSGNDDRHCRSRWPGRPSSVCQRRRGCPRSAARSADPERRRARCWHGGGGGPGSAA
jgi:hypothetical protein